MNGLLSNDSKIITAEDQEYSVLLKRITGSRLYGTQYELGEHPFDPTYISDIDYRGIYVTPTAHRLSLINQVPAQITIDDGEDTEFYDIEKFFKLAIDNNPNIMDILFGDEKSEVFSSDIGRSIMDNRNLFVSQKAKESFNGYAMQQLYRMKRHHRWNKEYPEIYNVVDVLEHLFQSNKIDFQWIADYFSGHLANDITGENAQTHKHLEETITIEEFSKEFSSDTNIAKFLKPHFMDFISIKDKSFKNIEKTEEIKDLLLNHSAYSMLNDSIYLIYVDKEKYSGIFTRDGNFKKNLKKVGDLVPDFMITVNKSDFKKNLKDISSIWNWKVNRNEKRSVLEARFGYDTKHGMHLYRLLSSAKDLLLTGEYTPRLNDENLTMARDILSGQVPYATLIQMAENLQKELNAIIKNNKAVLKPEADIVKINDLLMSIYDQF
jgi:predicted nucleotidyltransferase